MAALTTTRNGDWANSTAGVTPWTSLTGSGPGGVPGDGDTVTISHDVTITSDVTVGTSGATGTSAITISSASGAKLTITGAVLYLKGDLTQTNKSTQIWDTLIVQPNGSTPAGIEFIMPSGSAYKVAQGARCRHKFLGTSSARVFVRSAAGTPAADRATFPSGAGSLYGIFTATYADFSLLGDSSRTAMYGYLSGGSGYAWDFSDCTFDTCGLLNPNGLTVSGWGVSFVRCEFKNSQNTNSITVADNASATAGTFQFINCVFDRVYLSTYSQGATFTGNYFHQMPRFSSSAPNYRQSSHSYNFIRHHDGITVAIIAGSVVGDYVFGDGFKNDSNFHTINYTAITQDEISTNCITELAGHGGDGELIAPDVAGSGSYYATIEGCITLPPAVEYGGTNGTNLSLGLASQPNRVRHCNLWARNYGAGYVGETAVGETGMIDEFHSNILYYTKTATHPKFTNVNGGASLTVDAAVVSKCDYNCGWNTTNPTFASKHTNSGNGYGGAWTATPGSHDVDVLAGTIGNVNPNFKDYKRSFSKWSRDYLGNTANKGAWAGSTSYVVGDVVEASSSGYFDGDTVQYRCIQDHTSTTDYDSTGAFGKPGYLYGTQHTFYSTGSATGGTWGFSVQKPTGVRSVLNSIAWNAALGSSSTASSIWKITQDAMNAASLGVTITAGSGGPINSGPVTLTFSEPVAIVCQNSSSLTGGTSPITCANNWRQYWEFASLHAIRTAIIAGTTYTDATLGITNAKPVEALIAWVRDGWRPTNIALKNADYETANSLTSPTNGWVGAVEGISNADIFIGNFIQSRQAQFIASAFGIVPIYTGSISTLKNAVLNTEASSLVPMFLGNSILSKSIDFSSAYDTFYIYYYGGINLEKPIEFRAFGSFSGATPDIYIATTSVQFGPIVLSGIGTNDVRFYGGDSTVTTQDIQLVSYGLNAPPVYTGNVVISKNININGVYEKNIIPAYTGVTDLGLSNNTLNGLGNYIAPVYIGNAIVNIPAFLSSLGESIDTLHASGAVDITEEFTLLAVGQYTNPIYTGVASLQVRPVLVSRGYQGESLVYEGFIYKKVLYVTTKIVRTVQV